MLPPEQGGAGASVWVSAQCPAGCALGRGVPPRAGLGNGFHSVTSPEPRWGLPRLGPTPPAAP